MGLDISVIRTPKGIDLAQVYAVREAVEDGFDWYLGNEHGNRARKWNELKAMAGGLRKDGIIEALKAKGVEKEELIAYLEDIPSGKFDMYLSYVVDSISPHQDGNTHLFFDYDRLPGVSLADSCSWNLRDLLMGCAVEGAPKYNHTYICELEPAKVIMLAEKWSGQRLKMFLAKWIGMLFSPHTGFRILHDVLRRVGVADAFVDYMEAEHYRDFVESIARNIEDNDDRVWLVSSY